ncbi:MAG TPA: DUF192 domain-containing protein [Actinomycetota bacterium]|nr:DUF192 domain-containing protein [Actinomycetota bacterium]
MRDRELVGPHGRPWTVSVPHTRRERMRGLRGRAWLPPDHGLLLLRCRSVHTFGMRAPIAVAFLDADWRVLSVRRVRPGRVVLPRWRARHVLECAAATDLRRGDRLRETLNQPGSPAGGTTRGARDTSRRART